MFVKLLGAFDLFVTLILFALALKAHIAVLLIVILIIILAVKSLPFILTFCLASVIDVAIAIILLLSLFLTVHPLILVIAALASLQKGVASLL
ncbi:MAG: hypothetical protein N3G19_01520 [Candidatus Pacearchaeota archaeon]|nr:hypothetical protein [Candidatus Pacearchaeota archaeon]